MAFRGLLGLQGVIPVSGTALPGFTVNRLTGIWVDGAGGVETPGFTLNRLSGVWVDGAAIVIEIEEVGGGSPTKVILPPRPRPDADTPIEEWEDDIVTLALLAVAAIREIYYD